MTDHTPSNSQRQAYLEKVRARADRWAAEIDRLDASVREASAEARLEYHDRVHSLRKKRDEVVEKISDLKNASEEAWVELKGGVDRIWNEIEDTLESTRSALKQADRDG